MIRVRRRAPGTYEVEISAEDERLLAKMGNPERFIEATLERNVEVLREIWEKVKREVLGVLVVEGKEVVRLSEVVELLRSM